MCVVFSACPPDPEPDPLIDNQPVQPTKSAYAMAMEEKLTCTSWKLTKTVGYNADGTVNKDHNMYYAVGGILSFAPDSVLYFMNIPKFENRSLDNTGMWFFTKDDDLMLLGNGKTLGADVGALLVTMGGCTSIVSISDSELVLKSSSTEYYYKKISYRIPKDAVPDENSDEDTGEAPQIVNFTFTSTKNSITVKFYTDVSITKATIKYGTSATSITKSTSETVASHCATATVKNLKSGTKYYFKCTAKNKYGSSTSDVYPAMTNY